MASSSGAVHTSREDQIRRLNNWKPLYTMEINGKKYSISVCTFTTDEDDKIQASDNQVDTNFIGTVEAVKKLIIESGEAPTPFRSLLLYNTDIDNDHTWNEVVTPQTGENDIIRQDIHVDFGDLHTHYDNFGETTPFDQPLSIGRAICYTFEAGNQPQQRDVNAIRESWKELEDFFKELNAAAAS